MSLNRRKFLGTSAFAASAAALFLNGCSPSANTSGPSPSGDSGGGAKKSGGKFTLGLSIYTGWMPWYLAQKLGIIKKWADKYGITIEVIPFPDYGASLKGYLGECDAVVITNMDTMISPCSGGLDTTVVVVGDYSNGNDVLFTRGGLGAADLEGIRTLMVEGTVSQYLFSRLLEKAGKDPKKIAISHVEESKIVTSFESDASIQSVVTWNPWALQIATMKGVTKVGSSADIPEEIQDLCVVKTAVMKKNPDFARALTGAWFEVLNLIDDSAQRGPAIEYMAQESSCSPQEFEAQLRTTALYQTADLAAKFAKGPSIVSANERVLKFCRDSGLIKPDQKIGVTFPDGSTIGDKDHVTMRFDSSFMEAAAAGKL